MNSLNIKILALITMLIDHIGYTLIPDGIIYNIFRLIGKLSFPLYAFLIIEGIYYTKNKNKYALRLFIFALISEIPFDLCFYDKIYYPNYQNIFWTLFLSVFSINIATKFNSKYYMIFISYLISTFISYIIKSDYNIYGITLIYTFYMFRNSKDKQFKNIIYFIILLYQPSSVLIIPIIDLYNNKQGKKVNKYCFYAFYPLHLTVLYILKNII